MKKALLAAFGLALSPASVLAQNDEECRFTIHADSSATLNKACRDAIRNASDDEERAELLFRLAYAMNENNGAIGAMGLLEQAVQLQPENASYRWELGYTLGELGFYHRALEDIEFAVQANPQEPQVIGERAWLRNVIGDFAGALADYDLRIALEGDSPGLRVARAEALIWLGRLDEAEDDLAIGAANPANRDEIARQRRRIARMRDFVPTGGEAQRCELSDELSDPAIAEVTTDACMHAYLNTDDPILKADYLTVMSTSVTIAEQDSTEGMRYNQLAMGIDPEAGVRHMNYGYSLMQISRSWAARNAFDRALELDLPDERTRAFTLAGRARANLNLGQPEAAREDAMTSIDIEPTSPALMVLGILASDAGDTQAARDFWLLEYSLGGPYDELLERLATVGVTDPESEAPGAFERWTSPQGRAE